MVTHDHMSTYLWWKLRYYIWYMNLDHFLPLRLQGRWSIRTMTQTWSANCGINNDLSLRISWGEVEQYSLVHTKYLLRTIFPPVYYISLMRGSVLWNTHTRDLMGSNRYLYSTKNYFKYMWHLSVKNCLQILTHWGRDKIHDISQTTFSNAFSRLKMNELRLGFHWNLFLRFDLTIFQNRFR